MIVGKNLITIEVKCGDIILSHEQLYTMGCIQEVFNYFRKYPNKAYKDGYNRAMELDIDLILKCYQAYNIPRNHKKYSYAELWEVHRFLRFSLGYEEN